MHHRRGHRGTIVVTGMAFFLPLPGVIYQVLHYLIGLRRIGYDVYYIEDTDRWVYDSVTEDVVGDASRNVGVVGSVLDANGFAGQWAYRGEWDAAGCYGLDPRQIRELYRDADGLLNVTGQDIREEQLLCKRRIYVESDPFAMQVRIDQGDKSALAKLAAHDTHFTFGENIGAPECGIPQTGFVWLPTRQPVDLGLWTSDGRTSLLHGGAYTTITSWVSHVDSVVHQGETYYWQKDREFERFADLANQSRVKIELASNGGEYIPQIMRSGGWRHVPVADVAADVSSYRQYIMTSKAEFTVARDQYVRPRTGWFSDRSACYLASGRPVITQDTGFGKFLPTGEGLFAFNNMEEILSAMDAIESDYETHSRAARDIALEYFAAEKVVGSLIERAGIA